MIKIITKTNSKNIKNKYKNRPPTNNKIIVA